MRLTAQYFSVKVVEGVVASSFKPNDKVYIGADKLLPIERFLPKAKAPKAARGMHMRRLRRLTVPIRKRTRRQFWWPRQGNRPWRL